MAERIDLLVENGTLVRSDGMREADIAVADGRVVAVGDRGTLDVAADEVLGGVTTVIDMPNTLPTTSTPEIMHHRVRQLKAEGRTDPTA